MRLYKAHARFSAECNFKDYRQHWKAQKVTSLQNAAMLPSVYRMANAVRPLGRNNRNDPCTTGNKQHIMAWEKQFLYSEEHNLFI